MCTDNKILIKVHRGNEMEKLLLNAKESVLEGLRKAGYPVSAACGGGGRCGKCKVRILEGSAPVTAADIEIFSEEELTAGWRLACGLYPPGELTISAEWDEASDFAVVSDYEDVLQDPKESKGRRREETGISEKGGCRGKRQTEDSGAEYDIVIDIGTTTIAFQLLDKMTGQVKNTVTAINNQQKYGADVISRIQASVDGRREELQETIRKDLREGISTLLAACDAELGQITRIAIGCNTAMGHLLMGYDCSGLGSYPFTPVNIGFIRSSMEEVPGMTGHGEVILLPGISAYVGGDIVAGLYACDFDKTDDICLLVDLGTNGEMALGNRNKILVTSAAAGPAFEGGNISFGMGSVAGAICSVELVGEKAQVQTICEKPPVGICGTGVVEAIAELLREGLLDETGLLEEAYFDAGFPLARTADGRSIMLTQKDIREIQLAKGAIRAGVETLLLRYGISKEQVVKVYLAGGFGYKLNTDKAIAIGMLPKEFAGRIQVVGNSCLAGTVKYLREEQGTETLHKLVQVSGEIHLSLDKEFNELYMDAIMF